MPTPPQKQRPSEQIRHAWTAFAITRDPGWPTFDTGLTRIFDVEPAITAYPEQLSREIWRDHPSVTDLV